MSPGSIINAQNFGSFSDDSHEGVLETYVREYLSELFSEFILNKETREFQTDFISFITGALIMEMEKSL